MVYNKIKNAKAKQKGEFEMTNREKAVNVEGMIQSRMSHLAIDAKYLEKRDFYYKAYGILETMSTAIIWLSGLNQVTADMYQEEINRMIEDLDKWYYNFEL